MGGSFPYPLRDTGGGGGISDLEGGLLPGEWGDRLPQPERAYRAGAGTGGGGGYPPP